MTSFHRIVIALAATILAASAASQAPCFPSTPLIANSGFESQLLDPWIITGGGTATFPAGCRVDGRATSRCLRSSGAVEAFQPTPFALVGGVRYEFGFDAQSRYAGGVDFYIDILDATGTTHLHQSPVAQTNGLDERTRLVTHFTPQTSDNFTIRVRLSWDADIDNLYGRPSPIVLSMRDQRELDVPNTLDVFGDGNANFAVLLSFSGRLSPPVALPGICAGELWLAQPMYALISGSLDSIGRYAIPLTVSSTFASVQLEWQAIVLPPSCAFGCPATFEFF